MIAANHARTITAACLLIGALGVGGCQLYWTKPDLQPYAAVAHFSDDHRECIKTAGVPPGAERVFVNLDLYRACLRAKGWQRVTAARGGVALGMFRGQEDEGPVNAGDVPQQAPVMTQPSTSRRGSSGSNFGPR
jgi:hypothetical protein